MSKVSKWASDLVVKDILETLRKWEIPIDEKELVTGEGYVEIDGIRITHDHDFLVMTCNNPWDLAVAITAKDFAVGFCNLKLKKETK